MFDCCEQIGQHNFGKVHGPARNFVSCSVWHFTVEEGEHIPDEGVCLHAGKLTERRVFFLFCPRSDNISRSVIMRMTVT
jgi:hypothetical protein